MPQLGLGLGLNKGGYIKPLPKWLTDAGCTFAINVDRQVKALANPNSPFINPLVDVVGKRGKNLFDTTKIVQGSVAAEGSFGASTTRVRIEYLKVLPNTTYTLSVPVAFKPRVIHGYNSNKLPTNLYYDSTANQNVTFTTGANDDSVSISIMKADGVSTITPVETINAKIQLELGAVATTYEPYGFNNVLLQSFAGTTADGYTQIALPNGKNPWFVNSDGTDSYMIGVNTADTDILGTVNFGLGFYTRTNGTLVNSWLISKAESSEATTQYGVKITSAGALQLFLNGASITLATGLAINTPYKIVIVREAGVLKCEVNDIETYSVANSTNITTRPNLRLGARSSNVGGTTHTEFYNGYFGAFDLSQGSLCTLASFKKSFAKLIGGTYV